MEAALQFLADYGYWVILGWVFADQFALPLPSIPILIGAGALSATGQLDVVGVVALATAATLAADFAWYALGHHFGPKVLRLTCNLSIEPVSCISSAKNYFDRYGPAAIVAAKYIPGIQTLAPAAAGAIRIPFGVFVLLDVAATAIWVGPFTALGYFFHAELGQLMTAIAETSSGFLIAAAVIMAAYMAFKIAQWALFLRTLRIRRVTPEHISGRLESGETLTIIDLRQRGDVATLPLAIAGANRIPLDEIKHRHDEIPRDTDVVLYCTCPNEVSSARVALVLKRRGITNVFPLIGGLQGWIDLGYPTQSLDT